MLYTLQFKGNNKITSAYGYRVLNGVRSFHQGFDIVGEDDSQVHAPSDGSVLSSTIVTNKKDRTWEWGNYVKLRMGSYDQFSCHLAHRYVSIGANVTPAIVIGIMGNTGYSFGAHTHCEFRNKGKTTPVNPGEVFGLPNMAGVSWDREAMEAAAVGYLDCTVAQYRWRRGAGTTNDLYRDGNGVQMYCRVGVTYRVYAVAALPNGEVWCQITPPAGCANAAVPELWVSAECGTYTAKEIPAEPGTKPEENGGTAHDAVDWQSPCNEFIVSATGADRKELRALCERLQLPVKNA